MPRAANAPMLKAILIADAAGYAELVWRDEREAISIMNRCFDIFQHMADEHQGQLVKTMGDGVMIEFNSARAAVECAVVSQQAFAELEKRESSDLQTQFRIGIHLGDVFRDERDIYGNAVNISARLQEIAQPGQICVSETVYDQVRTEIKIGFEALGPKELKHIGRPIPVYQVLPDFSASAIAPSIRLTENPLDLPNRPSLVVLPFDTFSNVKDGDVIADGLTEDLTASLSRFREFFVISRNSAFAFRERPVSLSEIGRRLGVRYVVEGSVRILGDSVRITAQLIDACDDHHIWAEKFDGSLASIFQLQDEVVQIIASSLASSVQNEELRKFEDSRPSSFEAYRTLLRGWQLMRRLSAETNAQARGLFQKAIKLDPEYARAHAALARTWNYDWQFSWGTNPREALTKALDCASTALELDRRDPYAHAELGFTLLFLKQQKAGMEELERALSLNPNEPDIMVELSTAFTYCGRPDEAIELVKRAMRLNPYYPDQYLWYIGDAYFAQRRYQDVVNTLIRMTNPSLGSRLLAASYAYLGWTSEAKFWAQRVLRYQPDFTISDWIEKLPETDRAENEHFADGLRKSGLPD